MWKDVFEKIQLYDSQEKDASCEKKHRGALAICILFLKQKQWKEIGGRLYQLSHPCYIPEFLFILKQKQ